MKHIITATLLGILLSAGISACGDKKDSGEDPMKALKAERDSLAKVANDATQKYNYLTSYLDDVTSSIDSIVAQEEIAMNIKDPETGRAYSRKEMQERLQSLGDLIERQRMRIAALTDSMNNNANPAEFARLSQLVTFLNQQLNEKEAQLQTLQSELASSRRSIAELTSAVNTANQANDRLTAENQNLDQMLTEKTDQINQAWLLTKTKKELETMGVLSKGNLVKKSKFDPGQVKTSDCVPIDIRHFTEVTLNSKKKPTLLSQAPASSYTITEASSGKWVFAITDTHAFWSLSKIIVIELQ